MPRKKTMGRAANGNGTIRKKTVTKNGTEYTYWEARCTVGYDPGTGKQLQKSITGKTQKEVAQKLKQMSLDVDNGTYQEPSKITVGEWLDIFGPGIIWATKSIQLSRPTRPKLKRISSRVWERSSSPSWPLT